MTLCVLLRRCGVGFLLAVGLFLMLPSGIDVRAETAPAPVAEAATPAPSLLTRAGRTFVKLQRDVNRAINSQLVAIRRGEEPLALWLGVGIAFLYGVAHALGPGHGKAVVASYFLSREATVLRGAVMGGQIAFAHVISAIVIVTAVHLLLQQSFATPVEEMRALRLASYGIITVIGLAMLIGEARRLRRAGEPAHGHDHDHDHDHGHDQAGCAACGHTHGHSHGQGGLLSLAVGLVPCSGAVLILVYALANGIIVAGVLMTLAIAVGMGLTLAALGIASVYVRRGAIRVSGRAPGGGNRVLRHALALGGPLFITGLGAALFVGSL
jgi:ABC-type nickel/cobalt efflux system permease component RcnA